MPLMAYAFHQRPAGRNPARSRRADRRDQLTGSGHARPLAALLHWRVVFDVADAEHASCPSAAASAASTSSRSPPAHRSGAKAAGSSPTCLAKRWLPQRARAGRGHDPGRRVDPCHRTQPGTIQGTGRCPAWRPTRRRAQRKALPPNLRRQAKSLETLSSRLGKYSAMLP